MQSTNKTDKRDPGDMTHPRREEWVAYLYDEVSRPEKAKLSKHLKECAGCRIDLKRWQTTVKALDHWQVPRRGWSVKVLQPALKWAVAATVVMGLGFTVGRFASSASADSDALRASLKSEIRTELLAELKLEQQRQWAEYQQTAEATRNADYKTLFAAIGKVDAARQTDYEAQRKDLETMAVLTQEGLRRAQQQIVNLASYTQPDNKSTTH